MAWSETSWLWLVLFGLFTVFSQVPGSQGSEYCESYWDKDGNRRSGFWCDYDCCGDYNDKHCCDELEETSYSSHSAAGAIIGGIISIVIIGVIVCLIVCCCVAACPLSNGRYRGRVLGWGQGPVVTTTTTPVVMGQTNYVTTPAQPGVVVQPQPQPQAASYPIQYQPRPQQYPQPVAPPAYSAVAGPPPQYPPPVATQQPVHNAPPSAPPSQHVYEKLSG